MKLYFVFSAPIIGPVVETSGGLGDLKEIVKSEGDARRLAAKAAERDSNGDRCSAWYNSVDTETLEVSKTEYFE